MKIVICGEEKEAKVCECLLREIANKHDEGIEALLTTSGEQLLFQLDTQATDVDLVYIEYDLADRNGIEIAKEIRKRKMQIDVVICAADNTHVLEGYDVDAIYYIVKPELSREKFEEIFLKALGRANIRKKQFLSLFCAGENRRIDVDIIRFFEVKNRIVTVYYGNHESFEFYSTLSRLEEVLCGNGFVRIHQAILVSKKYIQKVNKNSILLIDGTELPVGRSYQSTILKVFEQHKPQLSL